MLRLKFELWLEVGIGLWIDQERVFSKFAKSIGVDPDLLD